MKGRFDIGWLFPIALIMGLSYWFFGRPGPAESCLEYHRSSLTDPRSAYIASSSVDKEAGIVRVSARSRNGYGGFVPVEFECALVNGKFDSQGTLRLQVDHLIGR